MSVTPATRPARRVDPALALKRALIAAAIAFGLFGILIGIKTDTGPTGALVLHGRPYELAIIVLVVFVGALARELILGERQIDLAPFVPASLASSARRFSLALPRLPCCSSRSSCRSSSSTTAICSTSAS